MPGAAWFDLSAIVASLAVVAVIGIGKLIWKGGTSFVTELQSSIVTMTGKLDTIDKSIKEQSTTLVSLTTWQQGHEKQDDERHRDIMAKLNQ